MKFIRIALGALVAMVNAAPFDENCLYLSDVTVGNPNINDRSLSDKVQLSKAGTDSRMRAHSFLTCTDAAGEVTGVQMRLGLPDATDEDEGVDLAMLGYEGVGCERLTLSKGVNKIQASVTQLPSKSFGLAAIRYVILPNQKTYGKFLAPFGGTWEFETLQPAIGLYGLVNPLEKAIVQIGFITLDTKCQEEFDARWDGGAVGEIRLAPEVEDNTILFAIIGAAALLIIITVVIVIVCVVKSKNKDNEDVEI